MNGPPDSLTRPGGGVRPDKPAAEIHDPVLAKAAAIIDRLGSEFPDHASRGLERLAQCATLMSAADRPGREHYDEISRIAHDLRGQGTIFGYPLLTRLAGSLCVAVRRLEPHDTAMPTIIDSHVAGMRALLEHGPLGNQRRSALAIATGLELMVRSRTLR